MNKNSRKGNKNRKKKFSEYTLDTLYKNINEKNNIKHLINYIKAGNTI